MNLAASLLDFQKYIYHLGLVDGSWCFIKEFLISGIYHLKFNGMKYPVYLRKGTTDRLIFNEIFIYKEYEFDLDKKPKLMIDIGANIGLTTLLFKNKYPDCKIIAIEPDVDNFKILQKNCEKLKDVILINAAVWSSKTKIILKDPFNYGACGLVSYENTDTDDFINSVTIDDIIRDYNIDRIDILKIDVEGAEKEIFKANYTGFLDITNNILIELHDRMVPGCANNFFKAVNNYNFSMNNNSRTFLVELEGKVES